jgi:hypothetical protein
VHTAAGTPHLLYFIARMSNMFRQGQGIDQEVNTQVDVPNILQISSRKNGTYIIFR